MIRRKRGGGFRLGQAASGIFIILILWYAGNGAVWRGIMGANAGRGNSPAGIGRGSMPRISLGLSRGRWRGLLAAGWALALLLGLAGPLLGRVAGQDAAGRHVLVITVDGVINPVTERYIGRAIDTAAADGAALLVIRLDTPGGLLDATRNIVERLLASPVATAVYVSPAGARAGSAGTFITAAANFAAMSPGTNIGAATPVSSTGQDLGDTLASKVENDAAALLRSIAQERGRNAELLEATVRRAASYTAQEALEGNVADVIAADLDGLLAQLDGRVARTPQGEAPVNTAGLPVRELGRNLLEALLGFLSNPNVSFLLLTIGGMGIVIELFSPGLFVPAVVGVICLLLAFVALGNLPVNWAGVALIILAVVLAAAEVAVAGFGVLGVASGVCLALGGLFLFAQFGDASPTLPALGVNRWLLAVVGATAAGSVLYLAREAARSRRKAPQQMAAAVGIGETGTVARALTPRGVVRIANDTWSAASADGGVIERGAAVRVVAMEGLTLIVARAEAAGPRGDDAA